MPVPEDGWTAEDINKILYINGKPISLPCTIAELGEGFEWAPEEPQAYEEDETSLVLMNYNGSRFALVNVYAKNQSELETAKIVGWNFYGSETSSMYINGITIDSTYDDVLEAFGTPTEETKSDSLNVVHYKFDKRHICFIINSGQGMQDSIIIKVLE